MGAKLGDSGVKGAWNTGATALHTGRITAVVAGETASTVGISGVPPPVMSSHQHGPPPGPPWCRIEWCIAA